MSAKAGSVMYRTEYMYLKKFESRRLRNIEELLSLFSSGLDPKKGFGFLGTEIAQLNVDSTLIYKSIVIRRNFDPRRNALVKEQQVHFHRVPFRLDLNTELLQAYAGGRRLDKLLSILSQVFEFEIVISDMIIDMNKLITQLKYHNIHYKITGLVINNYRPQPGLIGRYMAQIDSSEIAQQLIRLYDTDVTDVEIELPGYEDVIGWRLTSSGKISVRAREDLLEEQIRLLKQIALECKHA
jgi:hypothetical protein